MFIVSFVGLLLLLVYLRSIRRKYRFAKDASMKPVYYDRNGDVVDILGELPLRSDEFGAKLTRWFWPAAERYTLYCNSPMVQGIEFVATESYAKVNVVKASIDSSKILIRDYDPDDKDDKSKVVPVANNDKIIVMKDESNEAGYLLFQSGEKGGGQGFRMCMSFLLLAAMVAEGVVSWFLIQSVFRL